MARTVIRGCGIVTMNPARELIATGDIYIENGRLVHVGPPLPSVPDGAEVIDGRGLVAIPGFISTHHHLFQSLLRGFAPDHDLFGWVPTCIIPSSPHFRPEDLYLAARLSLAECIESGVTTTIDWSYNLHSADHAAATIEGMLDSGIRAHYGHGPALLGEKSDIDIQALEEMRRRYFDGGNEKGRMRLWAALGGPHFQKEDRFREEVEYVRKLGIPLHIHALENKAQPPKDALEVMERCGAMGPEVLLAHAIHMRDSDIDLVARTDTKISYNVLSNMRVAGGVCRVVELRKRGIDVSLGIDGSAANDNNDYFIVLRASLGLQRAYWMQADCVTVDDIVAMATLGGAKCLGQEAEIGSLEKGKKADVVLIDPNTLNFTPLNNFLPQLVFCGEPRNVDTVIVDGQVLKRKGELVGVDVPELLAKCREAARTIIQKGNMARDPICSAWQPTPGR